MLVFVKFSGVSQFYFNFFYSFSCMDTPEWIWKCSWWSHAYSHLFFFFSTWKGYSSLFFHCLKTINPSHLCAPIINPTLHLFSFLLFMCSLHGLDLRYIHFLCYSNTNKSVLHLYSENFPLCSHKKDKIL